MDSQNILSFENRFDLIPKHYSNTRIVKLYSYCIVILCIIVTFVCIVCQIMIDPEPKSVKIEEVNIQMNKSHKYLFYSLTRKGDVFIQPVYGYAAKVKLYSNLTSDTHFAYAYKNQIYTIHGNVQKRFSMFLPKSTDEHYPMKQEFTNQYLLPYNSSFTQVADKIWVIGKEIIEI